MTTLLAVATLAFYAESLVEQQGAALVLFQDREGAITAQAGDPDLQEAVLVHVEPGCEATPESSQVGVAGPCTEAFLIALLGRPYAAVSIPLLAGPRLLGWRCSL